MNQHDTQVFRAAIEKKLAELREKYTSLEAECRESLGQKHIGSLDSTQENELREHLKVSMAQVERQIMRHVRALNMFEDFGYCQYCGVDIPKARLEFDHCITSCVECQTAADHPRRH